MFTYRDGSNIMDIECDYLADRSEDYETLQQATVMIARHLEKCPPTPVKSVGDIELVTYLSYGKHNGV